MIDYRYRKVEKEELEKLNKIREDLGLEYIVHAPFPNPQRFDFTAKPQLETKILTESLYNAAKIGAKVVCFHPPKADPSKEREKQIEEISHQINEVSDIANELGIQLSLENKFGDELLITKEDFATFAKYLDKNVYFTFDTSHGWLAHNGDTRKIIEIIKEFAERINLFHLVDTLASPMLLINGKADLHFFPLEGDIIWESLVKALVETGLINRAYLIFETKATRANLDSAFYKFRHLVARFYAEYSI